MLLYASITVVTITKIIIVACIIIVFKSWFFFSLHYANMIYLILQPWEWPWMYLIFNKNGVKIKFELKIKEHIKVEIGSNWVWDSKATWRDGNTKITTHSNSYLENFRMYVNVFVISTLRWFNIFFLFFYIKIIIEEKNKRKE